MDIKDTRRLSPHAQEALRQRVVQAVHEGMTQVEAARVFHVSPQSVSTWVRAYRDHGATALVSKPRGRPRKIQLAPHQAATTVRMLTDKCPDQIKLPFFLWTREAVQQLLVERFGIQVSVWTVGRYLRRWGFTPQKPIRRAYEQDPQAVQRWLDTDYPAIRAQARAEGAEIHWGDEMGLRSDHQAGRTWGKRGQTPVVPGTGQRFGCNMISTVTNQGTLSFMVFPGRFTAPVFLTFLRRLVRQRKRKVFLIVDRHSVHRAAQTNRWLADHADQIRLFFLPAYSPELNPDELLNHDVKANAVGRKRTASLDDLVTNLRGYLRSTQRQPAVVQRYFRKPPVQYAAR